MNEKQAFDKIKKKLEASGTVFGDYYGALFHQSGPKPEEFFEPSNEGTFTLYFLKIPSKVTKKVISVDENKLQKLLENL